MPRLFPRRLFGYRVNDVDAYVREVLETHQSLMLEKDEAIRAASSEATSLRERLERVEAELEAFQAQEHRLAQALIDARARADQILQDAETRAEELRRQLNQEIAAAQAELKSIRQQTETFREQFVRLLEEYKASAEQIGAGGRVITPIFRLGNAPNSQTS